MQGAIPERKIPLKENNKPAKRVDIGGQAVLEGVMMRSPEYIALAVRRPDGSVVCKRDPYVSPAKKHKWMGWPFVRGAVSMVTMLGTGMKTLEESSKMGGVEDEQPTRFELWLAKKLGKGVDKVVMGLAIVRSVPSYEACLAAMRQAGCKTTIQEVGKDPDFVRVSFRFHPYMRRRLSLKRVSHMLELPADLF